jgi:endonuclease III
VLLGVTQQMAAAGDNPQMPASHCYSHRGACYWRAAFMCFVCVPIPVCLFTGTKIASVLLAYGLGRQSVPIDVNVARVLFRCGLSLNNPFPKTVHDSGTAAAGATHKEVVAALAAASEASALSLQLGPAQLQRRLVLVGRLYCPNLSAKDHRAAVEGVRSSMQQHHALKRAAAAATCAGPDIEDAPSWLPLCWKCPLATTCLTGRCVACCAWVCAVRVQPQVLDAELEACLLLGSTC